MLILFYNYLCSYLIFFTSLSYRAILSLLTSFLVNLYIGPYFINYMQKLQKYQIIRKNGPKRHYLKSKTPTMGGLFVVFSIIFSSIIYCDLYNLYVWYILSILVAYAAIGFMDDYIKIKYKSSQGLTMLWKYFFLSILALGLIFIIINNDKDIFYTQIIIPFLKEKSFEMSYIYIIFLFYLVIVGTSNAVNLTDGLDGLAIMPVIFSACGFLVISFLSGNINSSYFLNLSYIKNANELGIICSSIIGSGLGFLWFNRYPSQIFMGDSGSLSLGGALGTIAILLRQEFLFIIMGGIFVFETMSVILQIIYFKIKKKRIFKMSPIHHHYEILGLPEPVIIVRFWIISLILLLISLISFKVS